ncbi:hypothetical protein F7O44_29035 [Phytoactinopolyspora sp. XMNu-373]|uniref:Uncharacterized protein n=1 Tax=Phytoactinopolyspora mesophila TaxID=2650750 RepID=A0A7K3MCR5_9ACTN|nr:hypothetical protein [Phytoactinopolyspora mesophila]
MSEATTLYGDLGGQYAAELARHGVTSAMLTHKWQRVDLIAPHSDLDIRLALSGSPTSWRQWNESLAAAHRAAVAASPDNRRLLEHPPGFAFTVSEIDARQVAPAELATWSLINGHAPTLQRWRSRAQMAAWDSQDERFYRAILDARLRGRYQLAADSTDNVSRDMSGYRRHCVVWHYLALCWFAAACLATRTRCPGKTAALNQWRPAGLERFAELFLHQVHATTERGRPDAERLLRAAHRALAVAMGHVPVQAGGTSGLGHGSPSTAWIMTAGTLRVRRARWLYYLDPPPGAATGYLIAREAKELQAVTATLRTLAADRVTAEQQLAARMAELIPQGATTAATLRRALADLNRNSSVVEDFLTAPLG